MLTTLHKTVIKNKNIKNEMATTNLLEKHGNESRIVVKHSRDVSQNFHHLPSKLFACTCKFFFPTVEECDFCEREAKNKNETKKKTVFSIHCNFTIEISPANQIIASLHFCSNFHLFVWERGCLQYKHKN